MARLSVALWLGRFRGRARATCDAYLLDQPEPPDARVAHEHVRPAARGGARGCEGLRACAEACAVCVRALPALHLVRCLRRDAAEAALAFCPTVFVQAWHGEILRSSKACVRELQ